MRFLDGKELADYVKERQAKQVRRLRQALKVIPKLAIVVTTDSPVIETYIKYKKQYGNDIQIEVEVYKVKLDEIAELISKLNSDTSVYGIIIQLPLSDASKTTEICNLLEPTKDVDGLGEHAMFEPATPMAIEWLLNGYGIELQGKSILVIGQGKLVGSPLSKSLTRQGYSVSTADEDTIILNKLSIEADVIITATGDPEYLTSDMIKHNAIVVDAGTTSENGTIKGDVASDVYETRDDLTITPRIGGVGPLTIAALFDNVIRAAGSL